MGEGDTSGGKQCMQIARPLQDEGNGSGGEKDIAKIAVAKAPT